MSLNELLDLKRKPWCDIEVEDLHVDGTLYYNHISPPPVGEIMPFQVGPTGYQYHTIQSAINAAHATNPDDTNPAFIYVYPGTYEEDLTLYGGILVFGLGDNTGQSIILQKINDLGDYNIVFNAVKILGVHTLPDSNDGLHTITFNNVTFLSNIESNIFKAFNNSITSIATFNYCNLYLQNGVNLIHCLNTSYNILTFNNCNIQPASGASTNIALALYDTATNLTGGTVQLQMSNTGLYTLTTTDLVSGDNQIIIYCLDSSFICSFTASLSNTCTARLFFSNSNVACSNFGVSLNTPIVDNCQVVYFSLINCYENTLLFAGYQGPFINKVNSVSGLQLEIANCNYPTLTNVITNTPSSNIASYSIADLTMSTGLVNNAGVYTYQVGSSPNVYNMTFDLPTGIRELAVYDPGSDTNMRLGTDFITAGPAVGVPLTLTAPMSGSMTPIVFFGAGGVNVKLPGVTGGLNYRIVLDDTHITGSTLTISAAAGDTGKMYGVLTSAAGGEASISGKTNIILTNAAVNQTGSIVEFMSAGTRWAVRATVQNGSEWTFT